MTETPKPLTADEIADLKAKSKAATPIEGSTLFRYEHGGGRLLIDEGEKGRKLIADFYDESNREFYAAANPETIQRAIATIEQQREQIKMLRDTLAINVKGAMGHYDDNCEE